MSRFDTDAARQVLSERGLSAEEIQNFLAKTTLTLDEVAVIRGVADPRANRHTLTNWGIGAVGRQPGRAGKSIYDAESVWTAVLTRPGRSWRRGRRGGHPGHEAADLHATIRRVYATAPRELGVDREKWTITALTTYLHESGITDLKRESIRKIVTGSGLGTKLASAGREAGLTDAEAESFAERDSTPTPPIELT